MLLGGCGGFYLQDKAMLWQKKMLKEEVPKLEVRLSELSDIRKELELELEAEGANGTSNTVP